MSSVPPPGPAAPAARPPAPPPQEEREPEHPPWRLWMAPAAVVMGFGLGLVATIVVGVLASAAGSSLSHPTPAVSLTEDLFFDLSFVAAALYFASQGGRLHPTDFGYRLIRWQLGAGAVLLAGVSYYVVTAIYASLVKLHGTDKLPSELGVSRSTAALIGAALFVCVIAPICEEFFFRGFIFGSLRNWRIVVAGRNIGTVVAALLTGILFGLAHTGSASSQYLIPLGFLGFVLCLVRWWTRSLYPCMALHAINNSVALGYNELHWNAIAIFGLIVAALAVVGAITLPLAPRGAASTA
jgi:membrane protease YdiL (CAAX protease family)